MADSGDSVWSALAETWLAVSLGTVTTGGALEEMVRVIDTLGGTPCFIERDSDPSPIASDRAAAAILRGTPRTCVPLVSVERQALGQLILFAPPPTLATARLGAIVSLVASQHQVEARRQMILHEINNRIAALLANVDFVDILLEGASVDSPPLRGATPEQNREFLAAIGNVGETARALAQIARRKRSSPP